MLSPNGAHAQLRSQAPRHRSYLAVLLLSGVLLLVVGLATLFVFTSSLSGGPTVSPVELPGRSRQSAVLHATTPFVSIVTVLTPALPSFDVYGATADSILSQTLTSWEWIIVDDTPQPEPMGPPRRLPPGLAGRHNVRLVRLADVMPLNETICSQGKDVLETDLLPCGLGVSRALGLQLALGEHVLLLDGDTVLLATALEKFVWYLHTHPEAAFVTSFFRGESDSADSSVDVNPSREYCFHTTAPFTSMHRVSVLRKVGLSLESSMLCGGETWFRYVEAGLWGGTIWEPLTVRLPYLDSPGFYETYTQSFAQRFGGGMVGTTFPPPPVATANLFPLGEIALLPVGRMDAPAACRLLMLIPMMTIGGAERFNLDFLRHMAGSHGCAVTVVLTATRIVPWYSFILEHTEDVWVLENLAPVTSYLDIVHNLIVTRNIQIVWLSNSELGYTMLPYIKTAWPDIAVVAYNHMEAPLWQNGGYARSSVMMQPYLDAVLTSSQHLKEWMVERGASEASVHVEYTGADTRLLTPNASTAAAVRDFFDMDRHDVLILYAHRLVPLKQPLLFAQVAVALLKKRAAEGFHDVHFVIGGAGSETQSMLNILVEAPPDILGQLHWMGPLEPDEMQDVMLATDILFLPSLHEGVPLTMFEGMSLGIVIVGTTVGGIPEVVQDGVTGVLVSHPHLSDPDVYVQKLNQLVSDRPLLSRLSEQAVQRALAFSQEGSMARIFHRLFELRSTRKARHPLGCDGSLSALGTEVGCAARKASARDVFMWGARMVAMESLEHY